MIEELKKKNKDFTEDIRKNQELNQKLNELSKGQKPHTIVVTCSDSRVIPEYIFKASFGELFVIRTAGNVINSGELGTIEYGIEHLGIKNIIVLGHTNCGAIHASIMDEKGKYVSSILDIIKDNIQGIKDEKEASIINARKVKEYIQNKFNEDNLNIKSALYDIKTGLVLFE